MPATLVINLDPEVPEVYNLKTYTRYRNLPTTNCAVTCNTLEDLCPDGDPVNLRPVTATDKIYFQFRFGDTANADPENPDFGWNENDGNYWLQADVIDVEGNVMLYPNVADLASMWSVGSYDGIMYQNLVVDMSKIFEDIPTECFAIRISVKNSFADPTPMTCFFGLFIKEYTVEGSSDCSVSVLVEGHYNGFDCDGNFYGSFDASTGGGAGKMLRSLRVPGSFEINGFPETAEQNERGTTTKRTVKERAKLRTWNISEATARELVGILIADTVYINGEPWDKKSAIEKNNDENPDWLPDIDFERDYCERGLACD